MKAEQFFLQTEERLKKMQYSPEYIDAEIVALQESYARQLRESPLMALLLMTIVDEELTAKELSFGERNNV